VTCSHDSIPEERCKNACDLRFCQACLIDEIVAAIGMAAAVVTTILPSITWIKHDCFVRSSMRLSHWLYKLKPMTSISEMTWHLECGRDFEVNRNCKKTTLFFGKQTPPERILKEGTAGHWMLLCIGCTSVVQCERTLVLRSAEMRNLSAAEKR